jgi:hypothetical protein
MHAFVSKQNKPPRQICYKTTIPKPLKDRGSSFNICPGLYYFDQRAKFWLIYVWIHQEP